MLVPAVPLPWVVGQTFVVRYRLLGREEIVGGRPLRFVGERNGYVAGWLPGDAIVASPVVEGGAPLRSVPASEWFTRSFDIVLRPWEGHGILMLIPRRGSHSIWLFWNEDGSFREWYVNLEQPHVWHELGCDTRDDLLDLTCTQPTRWRWKDEDDLDTAVRAGALDAAGAAAIRAEGKRIATLIERWEPPFADGWERWRPDRSWAAPRLPPGWDETARP